MEKVKGAQNFTSQMLQAAYEVSLITDDLIPVLYYSSHVGCYQSSHS
jgi:hypothetical protein